MDGAARLEARLRLGCWAAGLWIGSCSLNVPFWSRCYFNPLHPQPSTAAQSWSHGLALAPNSGCSQQHPAIPGARPRPQGLAKPSPHHPHAGRGPVSSLVGSAPAEALGFPTPGTALDPTVTTLDVQSPFTPCAESRGLLGLSAPILVYSNAFDPVQSWSGNTSWFASEQLKIEVLCFL